MTELKQDDISLDIAKIFIHGLMNERGSLIAATLGQCSPETIEKMTVTAAKWVRPYVEALVRELTEFALKFVQGERR